MVFHLFNFPLLSQSICWKMWTHFIPIIPNLLVSMKFEWEAKFSHLTNEKFWQKSLGPSLCEIFTKYWREKDASYFSRKEKFGPLNFVKYFLTLIIAKWLCIQGVSITFHFRGLFKIYLGKFFLGHAVVYFALNTRYSVPSLVSLVYFNYYGVTTHHLTPVVMLLYTVFPWHIFESRTTSQPQRHEIWRNSVRNDATKFAVTSTKET